MNNNNTDIYNNNTDMNNNITDMNNKNTDTNNGMIESYYYVDLIDITEILSC